MKRTALLLFVLFCAAPAFAQVAFMGQNTWFPNVDVGGDPNGLHYVTLVQASNNTSSFITGTIQVFSASGAALPVSYDGGANATADSFELDSGVTKQIQIGLSGAITQAWVQITSSPNFAETTVIVQYLAGSSVLTEIGINPFFQGAELPSALFPVETSANLNTGIAIANPNSASVVQAQLFSGSTLLGTMTIPLAQNGYTAKLITDLFPTFSGIGQLQLLSCTTTACTAAGPGFVATALRLNLANNSFTALPVEQSATAGSQIVPHIAFGGDPNGINLQTVLYLTNPSLSGVTGQASLFDNNGNPIAASANGGAPQSSFAFTVLGGGVMKITLSGGSTLQQGWVFLTLPSQTTLIVNALFQTYNGPTVISEASVLATPPQTEGLVYVNLAPNLTDIGLALANPQTTSNTITLTLYNSAGFVFATQSITLAPFGHLAQYLDQIFSQLAGANFTGTLSMQSALGFSTVALRQNLTSQAGFAALPVPADIMFIPSVTNASIVSTNRTSGGQVNFTISVTDFSPNLVTPTSTAVTVFVAVNYTNLGNNGFDGYYQVLVDGTSLLNTPSGTLTGTFVGQNPSISSGTPAVLYVAVEDSLGNPSNILTLPFKF
ncbi:MAG TPA: hypothetical protein VGK48_11680 [Terriglobia bacterium]|jgi:hypothetical protein